MPHTWDRPSDVLIVGGGPAAAAAAITCRRSGLSTRLVTKDDDPAAFTGAAEPRGGPRPLESMHPGVETLLEHLGAREALARATVATYESILTGEAPRNLSPDQAQSWQGAHVNRTEFDRALLGTARACGAEIIHGIAVDGVVAEGPRITAARAGDGRTLSARWLIDASGRRGTLGRLLGFERRVLSSPLTAWTGIARIDKESNEGAPPRFVPDQQGWSWLTQPVGSHVTWTRLVPTKTSMPLPPPELSSSPTVGRIRASNVQWRVFRPLAAPGVVLCGDAGGILDPACGQGVLNALYSGIMAATCLAQSTRDPSREAWYLASYDQWFMERFEFTARTLRDYYETLGIEIGRDEEP